MENQQKPLRKCVRVIILKDDKVILGKRIRDATGDLISYDFVGGGVDENPSLNGMIEAVRRECLEEVGMAVAVTTKLATIDAQHFVLSNPERAKIYGGGEDHYFVAEFIREDRSLLGSAGDVMEYVEVTIDEAITLITYGPKSPYNAARLSALKELSHELVCRAF